MIRIQSLIRAFVIVICLIFFAFPVVWMVLTSLKTPLQAIAIPPVIIPTGIYLENWANLLGTNTIFLGTGATVLIHKFSNSVIAAFFTTAFTLILAMSAAYCLSRYSFKGRKGLAFLVIFMRMLPPIATVIPLYVFFSSVGLVDTLTGLVLAYTIITLPFIIWMLKSFIDDIPRNLEEASQVDGASKFWTFIRITLPLAVPGLAVCAVFAFLSAWNDFQIAYFLTNINASTLPTSAPGFSTESGIEWGQVSAYGTILISPAIAFAAFAMRAILRGLTLGSVKE